MPKKTCFAPKLERDRDAAACSGMRNLVKMDNIYCFLCQCYPSTILLVKPFDFHGQAKKAGLTDVLEKNVRQLHRH